MATVVQGHRAEKAVSDHLINLGYQVLDRNWKTPICEIDIIAKKQDTIFFVEVKYRINRLQGEGFEYITAKKARQMDFAARIWTAQNNWDGDYRLAAASVGGLDFTGIELVEL